MADFYRANELTNPGAESGTIGWTASGFSAISGGYTGSYCFQGTPDSSLLQSVSPSDVVDIQIGGMVLPQYAKEPDAETEAEIIVIVNYTDGTKDIISLPCDVGVSE